MFSMGENSLKYYKKYRIREFLPGVLEGVYKTYILCSSKRSTIIDDL